MTVLTDENEIKKFLMAEAPITAIERIEFSKNTDKTYSVDIYGNLVDNYYCKIHIPRFYPTGDGISLKSEDDSAIFNFEMEVLR